jgi:hypothetical protein
MRRKLPRLTERGFGLLLAVLTALILWAAIAALAVAVMREVL